jgi:DNA primase
VGRIPDQIVQQIRDRVDLVDLVGRYVTLKKAGRSYKGLCPFHGEKTPSFNVNPDRQAFYCFGCQEGGNAITFLMKIENLSFPEAARASRASAASRSRRAMRASAA